MKVTVTVEIDTTDPRFRKLMRIIENLAAKPGPDNDRGEAWEPPYSTDHLTEERRHYEGPHDPDEDAPQDGRQLLGWCGKQVPDMKGTVMSYGRKHGLASKIVSWTPEQVTGAYRHARLVQQRSPS